MKRLACPKCQGDMEEGVMAAHHRAVVFPEKWMPGEPHKYVWDYTKEDQAALRQVKTYCCTQCGYLESYANK